MLGVIRFFLASCVIMFHLSAQVPNIGQLSVIFFYVISGYLITLILNRTYKFNFKKFAANRFLRLYPTYYVFATLSLLLFLIPFGGISSSTFHPSWNGPLQSGDTLGNTLIFPWAFLGDGMVLTIPDFMQSEMARLRLIPSTWSIAVEIVCYFILWLITARTVLTSVISLAATIGIHFVIWHSELSSAYLYYPFYSAMLAFSVGSVGYFISNAIENKKRFNPNIKTQATITLLIISVFIINWHFSLNAPDFIKSPYFYFNFIIALVTIMVMHNFTSGGSIEKITKLLGDMSYPIFLVQYVGGYIAWRLLGTNIPIRGWDVFWGGYAVSIILSLFTVLVVDKRVQKIRNRIRGS